MVQNYKSPLRVYKYPFELVMAAYERRFPTCHLIPIVLACEIIQDETSADGAEHLISRRCKINVEAPYLLKKVIGVDHVFFVQTNTLNRRLRSLHIEAYNESFSNRIHILEKCTYSVHPENPEWTCFEQSACLDVKTFMGLEGHIERFAIKQYSANLEKGKEIIDYYVNELRNEGITEVSIWQGPVEVDEINVTTVREDSDTTDEFCKTFDDLHMGASASNLIKNGDSFQLEADYIKRCLGDLSILEESKFIQLRETISVLQKGKCPSDETLLRFLRAADFDSDKARENLCTSIQWRKMYSVDRILSEYSPPDVAKTYFPGGWHHQDIEGRPLYVMRLGQMDVKGLVKSIGEDGLLTLTLHVCEEGLKLLQDSTRAQGSPISNWSLLLDLEGLNMRHLWRPGIKALLRVIEIVEANYPETMGRVFIVRTPRVFPILWTLVSPFIDAVTRTKFMFYGGNDYLDEGGLLQHISEDVLPDFLGGNCKCPVVEGGLIPKSLYMVQDSPESLKEYSIYQSVCLNKTQNNHEVVVECKEVGCVITWDFDVLKHDVTFRVLYTKESLLKKSNSCTSPTTVMDKFWQEGENYCNVEPQIVCHDGESVQGSHVTAHAGNYILQWKYYCQPQIPHNHHHQEAPTAHIMYYTEFLNSADYRGSLSSLQSVQSNLTCASSSCLSR